MTFSLYIHIPFCRAKCKYCDFLSFACGDIDTYVDALCKEIALYSTRCADRSLRSVFIGGGTPSLLLPKHFSLVKRAISDNFNCSIEEITVECNPESVDNRFIESTLAFGVNRVSIGVQSLNDSLLSKIGRVHSCLAAKNALKLIADNYSDINADIMVGLPDQTISDVEETAAELLSYNLSHMSCYSLILERGTPLYREVSAKSVSLPDTELTVDMYDAVKSILESRGFDRYEISNFCRDNKRCLYNMLTWQREEYLGVGIGASSFLSFNSKEYRYSNYRKINKYISAVREGKLPHFRTAPISTEEAKSEMIMLSLRLVEGLSVNKYNSRFNTDILTEKYKELKLMQDYLQISGGMIAVKPEYFYVSNSIISSII